MRSKQQVQSAKQERKSSMRNGFLLSIAIGIAFCFLFLTCRRESEGSRKESSPKFTQYYNQGEQLYLKHCSNCHQKNGAGLGRVYPPLDSSDFMENNFNDVLCLIRFGKTGDLTINGIKFNQNMPGIPMLSDLEIAEISTYIYNTWQHRRGIIEVKEATQILQNCQPN
jgi:cytochrome c551